MADCKTCKRTDVKCCPTCGRGNDCDVYHKCGEDCIGFKPMTQGDKIRSMTDEELADFIEMKQFFALANNGTDGEAYTLAWLKSEVEEE